MPDEDANLALQRERAKSISIRAKKQIKRSNGESSSTLEESEGNNYQTSLKGKEEGIAFATAQDKEDKVEKAEKITDNKESEKGEGETLSKNTQRQLEIQTGDNGKAYNEEGSEERNFKEENSLTAGQTAQEVKPTTLCLEEAIKLGKRTLIEMQSKVIKIYNEHFAKSGFAHSAKEIIFDLEKYLQALLVLSSSDGRDILEVEMNFIWAVLTHANLFEGLGSIEETLERCKIITKVNPHALLLTVAVDKFYKKQETAVFLDGIYNLYLLSRSLTGAEIIDKKQLLEAQIAFAQAQGVEV